MFSTTSIQTFNHLICVLLLAISCDGLNKPCNPSIRNASCLDLSKECPHGWKFINGRCLTIIEAQVDFIRAIEQCASLNGILGSFSSDNDVWVLMNQANYKKRLVCNQKTIYIGAHLHDEQGGSFINLDDSPADWLSITGNDTHQCAMIRPQFDQGDIYSIRQEPVPCQNKADAFVCQVVRQEAKQMLTTCADKFDQDHKTMSCVKHARTFWSARRNGCSKKDCCLYQDMSNCYLDNIERVCDEREHLVYMWKEHFNRKMLKFTCHKCYKNASLCGMTSFWPDGESPPLWVKRPNRYGISGASIWYKVGQFPIQSVLPITNCS